LSYTAPYINSEGMHIPSYADIRDDLTERFKTIFGQDVYLENDSQDYQFISDVALKIYESNLTAQLAYNNRGPGTAVGSGLDGVVKINGIKRKTASYSTCSVVITGTAGTVITSGVISDANGNNWDLPETVTIGSDGTATVTATCQTAGDIAAGVGDLSTIVTTTKGWESVTNTVAATEGTAVETDSTLRARQKVSVALPSQTLLVGTTGAIAAVPGVTRVKVYENDTDAVDSNGLPEHSITAVVEGGADADIAEAIYYKKGIGGYTNGSTEVLITDSYLNNITVRFERPSYVNVEVTYNLKALSGYTTATTDAIKEAAVNFLNSFGLGVGLLTISGLQAAALNVMDDLTKPLFSLTSVTAGEVGGTQADTDITLLYNQAPAGELANITVNVT
jgi:uncharacterized phage protein gp47/JayE